MKLRQVAANKDIATAVESRHRNQLKVMRSDIATAERFTTGRRPVAFAVCPELPIAITQPIWIRWCGDATFASRPGGFCDYQLMTRLPRFLRPLLAGCAVTFLQ